jgi:hypothetical protein
MMKNRGAIIVLIYLAVTVFILAFIPPVEQLGNWIKLIIFHGILSVTALYAIYAAGLLGFFYLVTKKEALGHWSREVGMMSVVVWSVGTLLSFVSMQVAWGGMMWEPRTIAAITIVALGVGKEYLVRNNGFKTRFFALANVGYAVAVYTIRQTTVYIMHPENPTAQSDSILIRFLPWVMILFTALAIAELTRWRLAQRVN